MTIMINGNLAKTLLASIVSITLFACSSGSDTGDEELDAASFTRIGVISVDKTLLLSLIHISEPTRPY